ncbi:hypothetical protein [Hyphobacterium sp.]|uniref:hypothetical protein n=1 Tax=Hyphobacterium sp. TaxID=2004662 RepID=UPI003BAD601D
MSEKNPTTGAHAADDQVHPAARPFLWLEKPAVKAAPFYIFGALALALLVLEFFFPLHAVSKWDDVIGFYEIEGFVGFCLAVLMGWPLRRLLGRPEEYYDVEGDHD